MYFRNFLAAASFIAMVASAALPETQSAYVPGFEKSCVEGCKADGTANVRSMSSLLLKPAVPTLELSAKPYMERHWLT